MGITGSLLVLREIVRSKPGIIIYKCVKGICLGKPAIEMCMRELSECWFEIDTTKMAGAACKRFLICVAPFGGVAGVSLLADVIDHPAAKTIAMIGGNAAGLLITGPAYGVDRFLAPIETVVFGSPKPLIKDNRLFLFSNITDSI